MNENTDGGLPEIVSMSGFEALGELIHSHGASGIEITRIEAGDFPSWLKGRALELAQVVRRVAIGHAETVAEHIKKGCPHCVAKVGGMSRRHGDIVRSSNADYGTREYLGREVRRIWVEWAREQPNPKPHWLTPWEELDAGQREVDMRIGEHLAAIGALRTIDTRPIPLGVYPEVSMTHRCPPVRAQERPVAEMSREEIRKELVRAIPGITGGDIGDIERGLLCVWPRHGKRAVALADELRGRAQKAATTKEPGPPPASDG